MCLTLSNKSSATAKIAKEDIICFKEIVQREKNKIYPRAGFYGTYQYDFRYTIGRTMTAEGFQRRIKNTRRYTDRVQVTHGFHAHKEFNPRGHGRDYFQHAAKHKQYWVVCVIPKGTYYYEGNTGRSPGYCAEKMIILDRRSERSQQYLHNE